MRRDREHWSDSDDLGRVTRGATFSVFWIVVFAVGAAAVLGGLGFALKTVLAEPKGAADAHIAINSGANRIQAQERFQAMYGKIKEYDTNLDVAAAALKRSPSEFNQVNYDGLKMQCNSAVAEYNAEVGKVSAEKWLPADLPYAISNTDPTTDCMENQR